MYESVRTNTIGSRTAARSRCGRLFHPSLKFSPRSQILYKHHHDLAVPGNEC